MQTEFIQNIQQRLSNGLPGREAQLSMAPGLRRHYREAPKSAAVACVILLLFPKEGQAHFALIQRPTYEKGSHSGQISFPGGRLEESDPSLEMGALREAEEEVGIIKEDVNLLGRLTELYIPVSNFLVHPFVGALDYTPDFVPQPSEVESILQVPVSEILKPGNRKFTDMRVRENIVLKNTPYFDLFGNVVWGATAMMLGEFAEVL